MSEEFRDLAEGERYVAIAAVTETINRSRLTDRVLFEGNLDPLYLERFFLRFIADETRDLSAGGLQLFDRVLAQCSAYIIEIADKLPRFQAGAFTELLRRDSQILNRLEEVINRLPAPIGDDSLAGRVEVAYRQRIAKQFDRLELFGLDFAAQWYALSIAYVELTVSIRDAASVARAGLAGNTESDPGRYGAQAFEQWLANCPRLFIDGRAGSGKTTVLQWIAVRAARRDFTGPAASLNGLVPFFIRLREYAGRELPQPEQFLDKVAPLLAPEAGNWPRQQLFGGRSIVLIDGVDEVPEAQRRAVFQWIRDLTDFFPQSRYVVSARPGAIADDALAGFGFTQATLEAMSPVLVRTFIDQWHAAMREWESDAYALEQLAGYRDELLRILDNDRFLRELANTPLLAGLICALNQHLSGQLPRRRGEIFERALAMFHVRDRKRGIDDGVRLDLSATNHLLGDLALWMVRNAAIGVAEETARNILARSASALPARPIERMLYQHLLLRSGLLREPTAGNVDFVHRTFQEYLAAKALIASDNVGEIFRNAGDDQWREVVILATGQGNIRQTTDLLHGLMQSKLRGRRRDQRRLLAIASLDEIRGADHEVIRDVVQCIPELLPPRSMEQAEKLSHAGERLLPFLMARVRLNDVTSLAPTIRALSLVGTANALDMIEEIVARVQPAKRVSLYDELRRGWDYFRAARYPDRVLAASGMRLIAADSPWKLAELAGAPGAWSVRLDGFVTDGADLSALGDLDVVQLGIYDSRIRSLTGVIRPWSTVKRVLLYNLPDLADISALQQLPSLESLEIGNCGGGPFHVGVANALNLKSFEIHTASVNASFA
jgi:hypothetical protein